MNFKILCENVLPLPPPPPPNHVDSDSQNFLNCFDVKYSEM